MDQEEKRAFGRWLKTSTDNELQTMLVRLQALSSQLTEPGAIRDWRFLRKGVLTEIDARRELQATIDNRKE